MNPAVTALTKKVDLLVIKVDGLSKENSELRTQQQENLAKMESMEHRIRQQEELLAESKHNNEHGKAKFVLVDNSTDARWDTSDSKLMVTTNYTVKRAGAGLSIRSTRGFLTGPTNSSSVNYSIHYFEVAIDELASSPCFYFGLVANNYPMNAEVGFSPLSSGIGLRGDGKVFCAAEEKADFQSGLAKGDVVGCGLMVAERKKKQKCDIFFTKNGQLLGTPIPLPSGVPFLLYPAVTLGPFWGASSQVTANFGQQPFKYAIPPAVGLLF